ncbi:hypothetical protein ACWFMI_14945 [Nocardiopsis terrae]
MTFKPGDLITYTGDNANCHGLTGGVLKVCECDLCAHEQQKYGAGSAALTPHYVCLGSRNTWSMWVVHHVPAEHMSPRP